MRFRSLSRFARNASASPGDARRARRRCSVRRSGRARDRSEVRVAAGVHVAHRARHRLGRDFEQRNPVGRDDPARGARADFRVAGLVDQRRQPADLEVEAVLDQNVGFVQRDDEARLRLNVVGILVRLADAGDVDAIAADVARDGREIGQRGDDLELGLCAGRPAADREAPAMSSAAAVSSMSARCLLWGFIDVSSSDRLELVSAVRAQKEFEPAARPSVRRRTPAPWS